MADYDKAPPMPVSDYRRFQEIIPGVDALYRSARAILDSSLPSRSHILIAGAGAGREVEALGASPRDYVLTGFDPSADMLALASTFANAPALADRVRLIRGTIDDIDHGARFDAATSILVMHFLPDTGEKERYLNGIRRRLKSGAPYLHADVCLDSDDMFRRLVPAVREQGVLAGLPEAVGDGAAAHIGQMAFGEGPGRVITEARTYELFKLAGFRLIAPFFRGFWYAGWWVEAV
jgi:tRNA (cmo5U34)-methyltransferase